MRGSRPSSASSGSELSGGDAQRAAAEDVGVGVVDVGEPVVGAVQDGGEHGKVAEQAVHGQCIDDAGDLGGGGLFGPRRPGWEPRAAGTVLARSAGGPSGVASARRSDGLPFFLAFVAACGWRFAAVCRAAGRSSG